ncbi:MAG: MarR family transcriptional regulator [Methanobacteriota archaeon]|nr:MAG: MarR family transcriptional regulator [Euryarchaeota archaeon]
MHSGLELQSRRRIYEFLSANPGVHLRRIGQTLGMSTGMLSYHLGVMERQGLLKSEAARHRRRYYLAQAFRPEQRLVLALLRERVPRTMMIDLATHGERTFADLLRVTGVTKSTLSYHLAKVVASGVVVRSRRDRESVFTLRDGSGVAHLILTLAPGIPDEAVGRFVLIWPRLQALRDRQAAALPLPVPSA